ncbi:MAG: hypothetical protein WBZ29_09530 [Methanocella sp.]
MSQYKEITDADLSGRVMCLEQRTKGLQGRISAIEVRLSGTAVRQDNEAGACNDMDYIPAAGFSGFCQQPGRMPDQACQQVSHRPGPVRAVDATGLIAGAILIGIGILLYAGNLEILRNPIVAMGCGILLIAGATLRAVL